MTSIPAQPDISMLTHVRRTTRLALPLIAGNIAGMGMNFVDTVMAGRLGAVSLGAISIGGAVLSAVFLFVMGVLMSITPSVAQLDGAGYRLRSGRVTRQGLWLALGMTVLMWTTLRSASGLLQVMNVDAQLVPVALDYLRAVSWGAPGICLLLVLRYFSEGCGYTAPTMYLGVLGIAFNVPLNYILIYGKLGFPAMGAVGCGWATALVFLLQMLIMAVWIAVRPEYRRYHLFARFEWPNWYRLRELLIIGLPIGTMIFVEGSLFVGAALLIGSLGAVPIAAHQIAINFSALCYMIPLGLAGAMTVRVGNALGRGMSLEAMRASRAGMLMTLATQSVTASLMLLAPAWIISWYTNDQTIAALAVSLLGLAAIFQFPDGLQAAAAGALRGYKDTRWPMIYTVIAYWLFGMPVGWWLTFRGDWGAAGMWAGMIAGLGVAAVLLGFRLWRISHAQSSAYG